MAQTKRKRTRKHRGTPAGTIQRSATRKNPKTKDEKRAANRERRMERLDKPPSWRSSALRAAIAAAIFAVLVVALFGQQPAAGIGLAVAMFVIYIPAGYYTDLFMYRRRQRRKASG